MTSLWAYQSSALIFFCLLHESCQGGGTELNLGNVHDLGILCHICA